MAFIYDINRNFQPGIQPAVNTRGAYNFNPAEGSSNILNGGIPQPMTGGWKPALDQAQAQGSPLENTISNYLNWQMSDEAQQQQINRGLAAYKQMGDQQMKYSLINRGLTGLAEGIRGALTRYPDPATMAQLTAGVGDAYIRGAEATRGLTQLGGGTPMRYYNV
jgi:flagellar hook-length control protein FliK